MIRVTIEEIKEDGITVIDVVDVQSVRCGLDARCDYAVRGQGAGGVVLDFSRAERGAHELAAAAMRAIGKARRNEPGGAA